MKKIIILSLLITAGVFTAQSQTVDTSFLNKGHGFGKARAAAKITPVKVKFNDTVSVTHLSVVVIHCDLETECVFQWSLLDDKGMPHESGQVVMNGADYKAWDGKDKSAIAFVGKKVGISFQ